MTLMKIRLSEVRSIVRRLLIESYVVADKSDNASQYRVFTLTNGNSKDSGKILIAPVTMSSYGSDGIDGLLDSLGMRPKSPKMGDGAIPYLPSDRTPEQQAEMDAYSSSFMNASAICVVDVDQKTIDFDQAKFQNYRGRRPNSNKTKSYVIPHEGSMGSSTLQTQKVLKAVMQHDKRVDPGFQVVGNPKWEGQTLSIVLKARDEGNAIAVGKSEPVTLYHGTSMKRWEVIKQKGMLPGKAPTVYVDLVAGYSEFNVYMTTSISEAENYATRAAMDDRSNAAVLAITVRDLTKFTFDEDGANWLTIKAPGPPWTKREKGEEMEMHFRHQYEVPWQTWPNANEIWGHFTKKIIKNLHKAQTIGYKGRIPAKDIVLFASYKPKGMKLEPEQAEFDAARAETMATWSSPKASVPKAKASSPSQTPVSSTSGDGKSYKIYGRKSGAPAHTRLKGKVYLAGRDTRFKSGDSATVTPAGEKLRVKSSDSDHTQLWEPEG